MPIREEDTRRKARQGSAREQVNSVHDHFVASEDNRPLAVQPSETFLAHPREVLACITEIGSSLRLHMDPGLIAKRIAEAACTALEFRYAALYLSDGKGSFRAWAVGGGIGAEGEEYLRQHPLPEAVVTKVAQLGSRISQSYLIPSNSPAWKDQYLASFFVVTIDQPTSTDQPASTSLPAHQYIQSDSHSSSANPSLFNDAVSLAWDPMDLLFIPLIRDNGSWLGILTPDAPLNGLRPTIETVALLELFANQAAVAIEGARLYEEVRQNSEERAALVEIGQALSAPDSQLNLQTVYHTMYEQVQRMMPAEAFFVARYHSATEQLVMDYLMDEGKEYAVATPLPFLLQTQQILFQERVGRLYATAEDYARDQHDDLAEVDTLMGNQRPSQSLLFVPIRYGNEPLGILSVQSYHPHAYSQRHLELLKEIGVQAAIAMVNAHLKTELRDALKQAQEANTRLQTLASTDSLTGLLNRQTLLQFLEKEMEHTRCSGDPLSVTFFDGDHFKQINDTYGHAVGDRVLRELAMCVGAVLREGETVGRYGGEEFLVILPQATAAQACTIAERMREAVAGSLFAADMVEGGVPFTLSMGIATFPDDGQSGNEIIEQADQAMYWAKHLGRNQVRAAKEVQRFSQQSELTRIIGVLKPHEEGSLDRRDRTSLQQGGQPGVAYSLL